MQMNHEYNCELNNRLGGCHLTLMFEVFSCTLPITAVYINQGYFYQTFPKLSHQFVKNGTYMEKGHRSFNELKGAFKLTTMFQCTVSSWQGSLVRPIRGTQQESMKAWLQQMTPSNLPVFDILLVCS